MLGVRPRARIPGRAADERALPRLRLQVRARAGLFHWRHVLQLRPGHPADRGRGPLREAPDRALLAAPLDPRGRLGRLPAARPGRVPLFAGALHPLRPLLRPGWVGGFHMEMLILAFLLGFVFFMTFIGTWLLRGNGLRELWPWSRP